MEEAHDNMDEEHTSPQFTTSILTRRLKSFPPPNLEVLVGPNQQPFRYHAFILASQSDYVDTLLSSPAAMNERNQMRITFPEIEVQTWEKMVGLLEPGGLRPYPKLKDLAEILPLYDKYQFKSGVKICDEMMFGILSTILEIQSFSYGCLDEENLVMKLVVQCYEMNLPKTKDMSVKFARMRLNWLRSCKEEVIADLLPLLENDDDTLRSMVFTLHGKNCRGMTIDEVRNETKKVNFGKRCIDMCRQICEVDEQIKQMGRVKKISVSCNIHNAAYGYYEQFESKKIYNSSIFPSASEDHEGGAMKYVWRKDEDRKRFLIESADVFGNVWEMTCITISDDDESASSRNVLYRWEGSRSSVVPPKQGWRRVEEQHTERPDAWLMLEYSYEKNERYY